MDKPQYLDELPSELKMMIAQSCDYRSLRSIVHASPGFHSFYLSAREELLALVTIRQLTDRGFNFRGKYNIIEAGGANKSIRGAATTLYRQCERYISTSGKHIIRLDVRSSITLLSIKHAISWILVPLQGQRQAKLRCQKLSGKKPFRVNFQYEIVLLGPQYEPEWAGTHPQITFKMMIRRYHAYRNYVFGV